MDRRFLAPVFGLVCALTLVGCGGSSTPAPDPGPGSEFVQIDLATQNPAVATFLRFFGSIGEGDFGVPVAGGADCDGDGNQDLGLSAMRATVGDRDNTGVIFLGFGSGTVTGTIDSDGLTAGVLRIEGDQDSEVCGNEIWMADVTGDGIGDLIIGRQNFSPDGTRIGAGALTIVKGGPELRALAASLTALDLRTPNVTITVTTIFGIDGLDRFGIWMRTGDVDGDGTADIIVGADQRNNRSGEAYLLRGGAHLAQGGTLEIADLDGNVATIVPPAGTTGHHFGATCAIGDLDSNGRAEVIIASTLFRSGAGIRASGAPAGSARAIGGAPNGRATIVWDDNIPAAPWPNGFTLTINALPGTQTIINGETRNNRLGEEILAGMDYNGDGTPDLFLGDITGDFAPFARSSSGSGHVLFNAPALKGQSFTLAALPAGVTMTTFLGAAAGDISSDTAAHGDLDDDGFDDLAIMAPHGSALGRFDSGTTHVFYGRATGWPAVVDLLNAGASGIDTTFLVGVKANDVLGYSATTGDMNGDGVPELIINEMLGEGSSGQRDVGNLIVVGTPLVTRE